MIQYLSVSRAFFLVSFIFVNALCSALIGNDLGLKLPSGLVYKLKDVPALEFSYFDTYDIFPQSKDTKAIPKERMANQQPHMSMPS